MEPRDKADKNQTKLYLLIRICLVQMYESMLMHKLVALEFCHITGDNLNQLSGSLSHDAHRWIVQLTTFSTVSRCVIIKWLL